MCLNEDFGTLLDCLNLVGEIVIPLYYFDADNFGDVSDEDFRTVIDICKKYKVRYYRDSKNKGKDSGFRIFTLEDLKSIDSSLSLNHINTLL